MLGLGESKTPVLAPGVRRSVAVKEGAWRRAALRRNRVPDGGSTSSAALAARAEAGGWSRCARDGRAEPPADPVSARRGGFGAAGRPYLFSLPLHSTPISLLALTFGSGLVFHPLRAAPRCAYLSKLRVLADLLRGAYFEGAFGRPSNPGNRRLAAHKPLPPLLILVLDRVRSLERPLSRR
jgi:hypothetical protein